VGWDISRLSKGEITVVLQLRIAAGAVKATPPLARPIYLGRPGRGRDDEILYSNKHWIYYCASMLRSVLGALHRVMNSIKLDPLQRSLSGSIDGKL